MPRLSLRCLGAGMVLALALPFAQPAAHAAHASAAMTDFTRVTPANAILYATIQNSSAAQARNLNALTASPALKGLLNAIVNGVLAGGTGTGSGQPGSGQANGVPSTGGSQILGLLGGYLGRLVNGQLALAVLPPAQKAASGSASSRLHLLFDAGLQPGTNLSGLLGAAALFGFPSTAVQPYRGFQITGIDINQLVKLAGTLTKNKQLAGTTLIPRNGIVPNIFYGATIGATAVLASDLPTLQAAIDTYAQATPSIASDEHYTDTAGLLPMEHVATLYLHLGVDTLASALSGAGTFGSLAQIIPQSGGTGGLDFALALTALPHRLVVTSSTAQGVSSQSIGL